MEVDITITPAYKAAETYEQYVVPSLFRFWTPILLDRVPPQPGEQVLDVACGTGVVARAAVSMVSPGGKVAGIDINPAMLAVACKHYADHCEEIDWHEGMAERLPFSDQSYDLVLCQQGLQFFKDRPAAAREMHRVLRDGGRVGIEVWQSLNLHPVYRALFQAAASALNLPLENVAGPFAYSDPSALENLLKDAGFQNVQIETVVENAHFRDPDRYAELTFMSVAAMIPAFKNLDSAAQNELKTAVNQEIAGVLKEYTVDNVMVFPMYASIATAVR
ncbi:MAG: methyltransferase domain-containing protein [Chloroflexi bacterium]|nr:MAG: methyltransferase domain-containing protein [Chloroflexota bacterium]